MNLSQFDVDLAVRILTLLIAIIASWLAIRQFRIQTRGHLLEVYRQVFRMVDENIRVERHYLRFIDRDKTFLEEQWVDRRECAKNPDWLQHRDSAEKVFRTFDQLGLLVRQGRVPLDAIAPFCVIPILRSWHDLWPYIRAVRRHRRQPSHGWHFQNLVYGIVLPGLDGNKGVWKGVIQHDFSSEAQSALLNDIRSDRPTGADTSPGYPRRAQLWKLGRWY